MQVMRLSRHARSLAAVLMIAVMATWSDASASTNAVPCRPGKSKLIAADTQAVVYLGSVKERHNSGFSFAAYLGCIRGRRYAYEVGGPGEGSSSGGGGTRNLTVVGPIVAWEEWSSRGMEGQPERNEWIVLVRDLRTGRILHKLPTGTATVREWTGVGPTTEIAVNPDGAVAWIARVVDEQGQHGYEVHAADKTGTRLLASGTNIAPNSLALAGHTLYWTQGGVARSVPLS